MANLRKDQLKLAVLMEVGQEPKKNGYIVRDAEKRLNPDETYNRMMLNGKQTKGMKELQFILYDFKKDEVVEMVSRGVFKESGRTWNRRMELIFSIKEKIESGEIKAEEVLLNENTLEEIKDIYGNNIGWERKPEPELKAVAKEKEEEKETNTSVTGFETVQAEGGGLDFSSLENSGTEGVGKYEEKVIYDTPFIKAVQDEDGNVNIEYKNRNKKETDGEQVDNSDGPVAEGDKDVEKEETTDKENTDIENPVVEEPAEKGTEENATSEGQVINENDTEGAETEPKGKEKPVAGKKGSSKKSKSNKKKK